MTEEFKKQIETQARQAVTELLAEAKLKKGDVFVVGCSSSEIVGGHIGKDSSLEAAQAVYAGIAPVLSRVHGAVLSSGASEANHQVRKSTFQETLHVGIHQSVGMTKEFCNLSVLL